MRKITQAMILSAGLGTRMGALTKDIPKPMLMVKASSLIERQLNYLKRNNVTKVVINSFYHAELFEAFIKALPIFKEIEICFSREEELLGSGGGIKRALPFFQQEAFFTLNSDGLFEDQEEYPSALDLLEENWQPEIISKLLLTVEKHNAYGYYGKGDFDLDQSGRLNQMNEKPSLIYSGASVMDYRVFEPYSEKIFQLYPQVYGDLMRENNLHGVLYQGRWYHIGDIRSYQEFAI